MSAQLKAALQRGITIVGAGFAAAFAANGWKVPTSWKEWAAICSAAVVLGVEKYAPSWGTSPR
jgi:hypothetical protein